MRAPLSYVPALPAAIGWMAGIVLWYSGVAWQWAAAIAAIGVLLMVLKYHYPAFAFIAVAFGFSASILHAPVSPPDCIYGESPCKFSAVVQSVGNKPNTIQLMLRVDSCNSEPVTPFVVLSSGLPDWTPPPVGTRVHWRGLIDPAVDWPDFRGDLDMSDYYLYNDISATAYIDTDELHIVGRERSWASMLYDCRMGVYNRLAQTDLDYRSFGLISALLLSHKDDLATSMQENFRATGIAHALALSGFHVGIILVLVNLILLPLRIFSRLRRLRFALTIIILWLYAMLTGMAPSVVRAATMVSIYLFGLIIGRDSNPFNSLCVAVLIILAFRPASLFSPGFQLSVCAVLGILAFSGPLIFVSPRSQVLYRINQFFAVTFSAVFGTLAVTLVYFHRLPLLFIVSNAYISLSLPLLMYGGVALLLLSLVGLPSAWLALAINWLVGLIDVATERLASLSVAELSNVYLSSPVIVWIVAVIVVAAFAINFKTWRWMVAMGVALAAGVGVAYLPSDVPSDEIFLMGRSGTSSMVLRHNAHVLAIPLSSTPDTIGIVESLDRYLAICGVDTVEIGARDCTIGPFSCRGEMVYYDDHSIAVPTSKVEINRQAEIVVVGSRFKGRASKLMGYQPQQAIISRSVGRKKGFRMLSALTDSIPTIKNMRLEDCSLPQPQ